MITVFDPAKLHDITNSFQLKIKKDTKNLLLDPLFNMDESLVDKDVPCVPKHWKGFRHWQNRVLALCHTR
jgi:hypothetical protein